MLILVPVAKWRASYGRCGMLEFYLGVVATPAVDNRTLLQALRLIGNSCADTGKYQRLFAYFTCLPSEGCSSFANDG